MKMRIVLLLLAVFASSVALAGGHGGPTPEAKALIKAQMAAAAAVTPAELKAKMEKGEVVLIDVRQDSEIDIMGRIKPQGEQFEIPRGYIEIKTYGKVKDRDADIVAYCGKGIRSAFVVNTLKDMGYTNVSHLKGGAKAWKEAGYATH